MHGGEDFGIALGRCALLDHAEDHDVDEHGLFGDVVGGEEFDLCLIGEARPQRAKGGVEQDGVVDDADGVGDGFLAFAKGEVELGIGVVGEAGADGDAYEAAKGVV